MPKFIHKGIINENSELPETTVTWKVKNRHLKYLLKTTIVVKTGGANDDMDWSDDESDSASESGGKSNVMGESSPANENVNSMNESTSTSFVVASSRKDEHIYVRLKVLKYKYHGGATCT